MSALEDHYSFLLPRHDFSATLLPMHLMDIAKRARASTPGLDGWPMQAWFWFLIVCRFAPLSVLSSVTSVFKRVPVV